MTLIIDAINLWSEIIIDDTINSFRESEKRGGYTKSHREPSVLFFFLSIEPSVLNLEKMYVNQCC